MYCRLLYCVVLLCVADNTDPKAVTMRLIFFVIFFI
jgi:hypothetical protein